MDLSNSKNAELRNLVQQTITNLQNYIANGQVHESKNSSDNKNAIQKFEPSTQAGEHMDNTSSQNNDDTKPFEQDAKEKVSIIEEKHQDEHYVNALCKLGHLHLLLGEYSEGKYINPDAHVQIQSVHSANDIYRIYRMLVVLTHSYIVNIWFFYLT